MPSRSAYVLISNNNRTCEPVYLDLVHEEHCADCLLFNADELHSKAITAIDIMSHTELRTEQVADLPVDGQRSVRVQVRTGLAVQVAFTYTKDYLETCDKHTESFYTSRKLGKESTLSVVGYCLVQTPSFRVHYNGSGM
jgi:hypothetical protein